MASTCVSLPQSGATVSSSSGRGANARATTVSNGRSGRSASTRVCSGSTFMSPMARIACETKRIFLPFESMRVKRRSGFTQRERQPGKSRTGARIRYGGAVQIAMNGEAVEHMMTDHALEVGDAGEIELAVPVRQLLEELAQPGGIVLRQRHAQSGGIVYETLQHRAIIFPSPCDCCW